MFNLEFMAIYVTYHPPPPNPPTPPNTDVSVKNMSMELAYKRLQLVWSRCVLLR